MKYLVLVALFFLSIQCTSQIIRIQIVNESSNEIIPFANLIKKGGRTGWCSDSNGIVTFNLNSLNLKDSIIISSIGFKKKSMLFSEIYTNKVIYLSPHDIQLKEVKIKSRRYKKAKLGIKKVSRNWGGITIGKEPIYFKKSYAKFIPNDIGATGIIKNVRIFVRLGSEIPFYVNILEVNKLDGSPGSSLLSEPLAVLEKEDKKWVTVDVRDQNIHLSESGFFVSIELSVDSANSELNYYTYKVYYQDEKKARIDTFFYRSAVIGSSYEKEANWWSKTESNWSNVWKSSFDFYDTCTTCNKSWNIRTDNKQTLALYSTILYSKSIKKLDEKILESEGVVNAKDRRKILEKKFEFVPETTLVYPVSDVFELLQSIQRTLDSNYLNYIAHHLIAYNYSNIDKFSFDINSDDRRNVIYDIEHLLSHRDKVKLSKIENGFYNLEYDFQEIRISANLLVHEGKWKIYYFD